MKNWKEVIKLIREWLVLREKSIEIAKKISTIRNESSYLSNEHIDQAIGDLMKPGRLTSNVDNSFNVTCKELDDIHYNMSNVLEHIVILASNLDYNNDYDCPIDKSYVDKMLHQLKQTMLLELSIASNLSFVIDDNGYTSNSNKLILDNDVLVTLLACYTYPPYLDLKEIETLIEIE